MSKSRMSLLKFGAVVAIGFCSIFSSVSVSGKKNKDKGKEKKEKIDDKQRADSAIVIDSVALAKADSLRTLFDSYAAKYDSMSSNYRALLDRKGQLDKMILTAIDEFCRRPDNDAYFCENALRPLMTLVNVPSDLIGKVKIKDPVAGALKPDSLVQIDLPQLLALPEYQAEKADSLIAEAKIVCDSLPAMIDIATSRCRNLEKNIAYTVNYSFFLPYNDRYYKQVMLPLIDMVREPDYREKMSDIFSFISNWQADADKVRNYLKDHITSDPTVQKANGNRMNRSASFKKFARDLEQTDFYRSYSAFGAWKYTELGVIIDEIHSELLRVNENHAMDMHNVVAKLNSLRERMGLREAKPTAKSDKTSQQSQPQPQPQSLQQTQTTPATPTSSSVAAQPEESQSLPPTSASELREAPAGSPVPPPPAKPTLESSTVPPPPQN